MWSVESNKMFKKTLSQTLNSEVSGHKRLVVIKRWTDKLRPPLRDYAHVLLRNYLSWLWLKPIYLHNLPLKQQINNVKREWGQNSEPFGQKSSDYVWEGDGDWHH